jgi:TetR/AcrR family transcriptional regulator, mexJK operon transcriptional repressor
MRGRARTGSARQVRTEKAIPTAAAKGRLGGRPSRLQSERLGERILDVATDLFLSHGYAATSIDAVARRARISKRTFYHRFEDKSALFGAVVHRIIDRLRPPPGAPLISGANLQQILQRVAAFILRAALSPQAIALHRLIVAESVRFPKLAAVVTEQGAMQEAIRFIAGILDREARAGNLALDNPAFAAEQFLYMVIALPRRRAMGFGKPMRRGELDPWARDVTNLFLNGCLGWKRGTT